jgi:hypothetical protein
MRAESSTTTQKNKPTGGKSVDFRNNAEGKTAEIATELNFSFSF